MNTVVAVVCLFAASAVAPLSGMREWKSDNGQFTVNAALVSIHGEEILLKKVDDQEIRVPIKRLSNPDQSFVGRFTEHDGRRLERQFSLPGATAVAACMEKRWVAAAGQEKEEKHQQLKIWNLDSGEEVAAFRHDGATERVGCLVFVGKGELLAVAAGDEHRAVLYDTATWKVTKSFDTSLNVLGLAASPDGALLAGNLGSTVEKSVVVWEIASGKVLYTLRDHAQVVAALEFANSSPIVAAGTKGEVALWDTTNGRLIKKLLPDDADAALFRLAFSADDRTLAGAGSDGCLYVWDVASGKVKQKISVGSKHIAFWVGLSPDSRTLYSRVFERPSDSSGLGLLLSMVNSGNIDVWNVETGEKSGYVFSNVQLFTDTHSAHLTADGRRLVICSLGDIDVWSINANP